MALIAVIQEAEVHGVLMRAADDLVKAMDGFGLMDAPGLAPLQVGRTV